jgi:hypothetical protein
MYPWWPPIFSEELILPLRNLGKRNLRHGLPTSRIANIIKPDGSVGDEVLVNGNHTLIWDGELSLAEKVAMESFISHDLMFAMAHILADGPKIFKLPAELLHSLNSVDIPLKVRDFAPPFPTTIVVHPNGEYHFVVFKDEMLGVSVYRGKNVVDLSNMLVPDNTIEAYLQADSIYNHNHLNDGYDLMVPMRPDEAYNNHRFRATLNFLLLATMEGQVCVMRADSKRRRAMTREQRAACPEVYEVKGQNIKLFQARSAPNEEEWTREHKGGTKRPHLRRAYWSRKAVGPGRTGRRLTFNKWSFVNKHLLGKPDLAGTDYSAE